MKEFVHRELARMSGKSVTGVSFFTDNPTSCRDETAEAYLGAMRTKISRMIKELSKYERMLNISDISLLLEQIEAIAEQAKQGNESALQAYANLKDIEDSAKIAKSSIKDEAVDELEKYAKGDEPLVNGFKPSIYNSGKHKFNYPPVIQSYQEAIKGYEEAAKLGKLGMVYCTPDGEEVTVEPALKPTSTSIRLTKVKL